MNKQIAAFELAVSKAGKTDACLAEILGVSRQRISDMRTRLQAGKKVPAVWAQTIEKKLGLNKATFRPDLWGDQ